MNRSLVALAIGLSISVAAQADFAGRCSGELSYGDAKTVAVLFAKVGEKAPVSPESCAKVGRALESKASLDLSDKQLTSVELVAELGNLQILNLSLNQIEDIRPLAYLKNLQVLLLSKNKLTNIEAVRDLRELKHLEVGSNFITDIGPVEYLESLQTLSIPQNKVSDLRPVSSLGRLQFLWMAQNGVRDVSPLAELRDLRVVSLGMNPIADYQPLFELQGYHMDSHGERIRLEIIGRPVPRPAPCVTVPSPCGPCGQPVFHSGYFAPTCGSFPRRGY